MLVGVLTVLGTAGAWQKTKMLQHLLARHGIPFVEPEGFSILPHYLMERGAVVCQGMPPYKFREQNPAVGRIPPQRTDTGCFLIAEVFGARNLMFLKDVDGLYTADPRTSPGAPFIAEISAAELIARSLATLPIDRAILNLLVRAKLARKVQIINGLVPGNLTRALAEEAEGTTIYA
jgi:molybdenum storage protein